MQEELCFTGRIFNLVTSLLKVINHNKQRVLSLSPYQTTRFVPGWRAYITFEGNVSPFSILIFSFLVETQTT